MNTGYYAVISYVFLSVAITGLYQ